jgi:streptogramin lyase
VRRPDYRIATLKWPTEGRQGNDGQVKGANGGAVMKHMPATIGFSFFVACVIGGCGGGAIAPLQSHKPANSNAPLRAATAAGDAATLPPGRLTRYRIPTTSSSPSYITTANDGALWFTEEAADKVARITTAGTITEFSVGSGIGPYGITQGPDGRPWFGAITSGQIGTISATGQVKLINGARHPEQLVGDSRRNAVWFADSTGFIGKVDVSTGTITAFVLPNHPLKPRPTAITLDALHNVWFTDSTNDLAEEMGPDGHILKTRDLRGSQGWRMTGGHDKMLWLVDYNASVLLRVHPVDHSVTVFKPPTANTHPTDIAVGKCDCTWFTEGAAMQIARAYSPGSSEIKEFRIPNSDTYGIVEGPDRNMWVVDRGNGSTGWIDKVTVGKIP